MTDPIKYVRLAWEIDGKPVEPVEMITGYTDEEFWQLEVPSIDARIWKTFERLQRERDEARLVAKVLAVNLLLYSDVVPLGVYEKNARDTALAYPGTKEEP